MERTVGLLAVLLLPLLAGCLEGPADDSPVIITDPADFEALEEAVATGRPHIHDYWGGQERLRVMDKHENSSSGFHFSQGHYPRPFELDEGQIIPLGTKTVEVTVSWTENLVNWRVGDKPLELWIQTAADDEPVPFAQVDNGDTVVFESSNQQNDIPHQRVSAWMFVVAVPSGVEHPSVTGADHTGSHNEYIRLQVDAVRGLKIPPYPGHPDVWGDATEMPLLDVEVAYNWYSHQEPGAHSGSGACLLCSGYGPMAPDDGVIVPYDADHIDLVLTLDDVDSSGQPLTIWYRGADSRTWKEAPVHAAEGWERQFRIPIDGDGDSPYGLQSLWRFSWAVDAENGPYASEGRFTLTATAHKEVDR